MDSDEDKSKADTGLRDRTFQGDTPRKSSLTRISLRKGVQ